jgi:DNA-binding NarL/FixJ family response regulator
MSTLRAFIVEDNPTILSNLVSTLEELTDVRVVGSAASEASAVQALQQHAHELDLVIVDIFLSGGTGLGVLETAQAMALPAHRVVLSNFATPELRRRCLALGAAQVYDKSRDLDALLDYCDQLSGA